MLKKVEFKTNDQHHMLLQNEKVKSSLGNNEEFEDPRSSSILVHEEHYYALKPQRNPVFKLLDDLKNYRVDLSKLSDEILKRDIEQYFPP